MKQKLLLRCHFTLGDVVLLTAAVRDLHHAWPGRFTTDVRSGFPAVWENNPYLERLGEHDPPVRVIDCDVPLVHESNRAARHVLHGFIEFLRSRLAVDFHLTTCQGDIYLSEEERTAPPILARLTGREVPYWLINAGGKHDCTIKWWDPARYQAIVDHFRDRIQFVQVGSLEHRHPPLDGVVDLRGRTSVRELIRLMHRAEGVVCGVTALMHLAAAVPRPEGPGATRPCVVIAGGRESPTWEAYPGHQFLHTVGALDCCASGGCWRQRTRPLGDGRDRTDELCLHVHGELPACMDLIRADDVIRRIDLYLAGGTARPLSPGDQPRAQEVVAWSREQASPPVPLHFHNAPEQATAFIARIPPCPKGFAGRGIVICAGGARMFSNAWVCIRMLRHLGCTLPIELWHRGAVEMDGTMEALVRPWDVVCIDITRHPPFWPANVQAAWAVKPYALLNSRFAEMLLLDADNVPVEAPEFLFEDPGYQRDGALFWPDVGRLPPDAPAWRLFDVAFRDEPEIESGQILVDKQRCWAALALTMWYNENANLFYQHVHGDKETFHLAFRRLNAPYSLVPHPVEVVPGAMYQRAPDGRRLFQHRNLDKWSLRRPNRAVPDFRHEDQCRAFLQELAQVWDGRLEWLRNSQEVPETKPPRHEGIRVMACLVSQAGREHQAARVRRQLEAAQWPENALFLTLDDSGPERVADREAAAAYRALRAGLETDAEYFLYLEDDVELTPHFGPNLERWAPLARGELQLGSLCNLGARELAWDVPGDSYLVHPLDFRGSQALLFSRGMLEHCLSRWGQEPTAIDLKLGAILSDLRQPVFYHVPSLARHLEYCRERNKWVGATVDYDADWRTPGEVRLALQPARLQKPTGPT